MHVHVSALSGLIIFLFVLLYGTAWHLIQAHMSKRNPSAAGAMAAQL